MSVAVDLFWDAENSTDGTTMTTTIMGNGSHVNGAIGAWNLNGTSNFTVSTSGQKGNGTREFTVGGTPYTDSAGTRGMRQDHSAQGDTDKWFYWEKTVPTAKWTASIWFKTGIAYQDFESYTVFGLLDSGFAGGAMFNLQTFSAGSHETYIENVSSDLTQGPSLSKDTWYLICLKYDKANNLGSMAIYDTSYAQVGSTVTQALNSAGSPGDCSHVRVGSFGGGFPSHPVFSYYDDLAVDTAGTTFPLIPTVAAGGSTAKQLMMLGVG